MGRIVIPYDTIIIPLHCHVNEDRGSKRTGSLASLIYNNQAGSRKTAFPGNDEMSHIQEKNVV